MSKLGDYVRDWRNAKDWSQAQMAKAIGRSEGYISQLETGINPSTGRGFVPTVPTLEALSRVMGDSVDFLRQLAKGITPDPSPPGTPWQDEQDPEIRARMEELKTLPIEQRRVILAGLKAQIAAARGEV